MHGLGGVGWGELKSLELEPGVRKRWGEGVKNLSLVIISNIKIELETQQVADLLQLNAVSAHFHLILTVSLLICFPVFNKAEKL